MGVWSATAGGTNIKLGTADHLLGMSVIRKFVTS